MIQWKMTHPCRGNHRLGTGTHSPLNMMMGGKSKRGESNWSLEIGVLESTPMFLYFSKWSHMQQKKCGKMTHPRDPITFREWFLGT